MRMNSYRKSSWNLLAKNSSKCRKRVRMYMQIDLPHELVGAGVDDDVPVEDAADHSWPGTIGGSTPGGVVDGSASGAVGPGRGRCSVTLDHPVGDPGEVAASIVDGEVELMSGDVARIKVGSRDVVVRVDTARMRRDQRRNGTSNGTFLALGRSVSRVSVFGGGWRV